MSMTDIGIGSSVSEGLTHTPSTRARRTCVLPLLEMPFIGHRHPEVGDVIHFAVRRQLNIARLATVRCTKCHKQRLHINDATNL